MLRVLKLGVQLFPVEFCSAPLELRNVSSSPDEPIPNISGMAYTGACLRIVFIILPRLSLEVAIHILWKPIAIFKMVPCFVVLIIANPFPKEWYLDFQGVLFYLLHRCCFYPRNDKAIKHASFFYCSLRFVSIYGYPGLATAA